ncbi:MAG: FliH/SctL family protein [Bacillota bacterium]|nr:FliH/SctL family protein [Bacillota bacterium]MDW7683014.1 FliH/SctL family protein [Bacillota bacterium]
MPSLSSVIKAERVRLNGKVCRLPVHRLHAGCGGAAPSSPAASVCEPDPKMMAEAKDRAAEIVSAARHQAEELLAAAQKESGEILKQAEMKILALEEDATKNGYDTGYLEGMAQGQREGNRLRHEGEVLLQEARQLRDGMLERVEPQVVELAVCIAEKLVGLQLGQEPETVVAIVRDALRQVREAGEILIRIHPEDLPLCREKLPDLQAELRENSSLNLFADSTLKRGGCRVETSGAVIECLLDERFARLREVLAGVTPDE